LQNRLIRAGSSLGSVSSPSPPITAMVLGRREGVRGGDDRCVGSTERLRRRRRLIILGVVAAAALAGAVVIIFQVRLLATRKIYRVGRRARNLITQTPGLGPINPRGPRPVAQQCRHRRPSRPLRALARPWRSPLANSTLDTRQGGSQRNPGTRAS